MENKLREHAFDVLLERERRKGIHVEKSRSRREAYGLSTSSSFLSRRQVFKRESHFEKEIRTITHTNTSSLFKVHVKTIFSQY